MWGAIGAGVIIVIVLLLVFVFPMMSGGASMAVIRQYAPPDTFMVASIDFRNVINSDLYKTLGLEEFVNKGMMSGPTTVKPEDIGEILVFMTPPRRGLRSEPKPMIVIRLTRDISLKEGLDPRLASRIKKHEGIEYVRKGRELIAKTDTSTVCVLTTGGTSALKKLVSRLKAGETTQLNDSLRSALDRVSGEASFMAMYVPDSMKGQIAAGNPVMASVQGAAVGFSVGSGVELKAVAIFSEDENAEAAVKMVDGFKTMGVGAIKQMAVGSKDSDVKSVLGTVAKTLDGIKIRQSGNEVLADASIAGSDIVLVKDKFAKVAPALMGGGGPVKGGKPGGDPLSAIMGLFGQ